MAAKLAGAMVAAPVGAILGAAAPGRLGPLVIVATPLAGFLAPDWWLARRARDRARTVRRDLPALLDLLRVSVDAGLAPAAALRAVAQRATGPLAAEWGTVAREVDLGVPLTVAIERSAARLPLPEVRELAAAITRATRHGAPLGGTLAAQAAEARAARRRRIEEEAAKAGPKIQLVVALLLVPSVLLLVAAALAAALLGGGAEPLPVGP
jgi:tight adherence protein C